uniref:Uncharacterized protein n=1 Tax=Oryza brachyantha TaxID=4533 RepID=J3MEI2_ORYBR
MSSSASARPRRAAAAKGWRRPARVSCFRQGQDVPTASDDGAGGFEHISPPEGSRGLDANAEEGEGSSEEGERNSEEGDWFVTAQKIKRNLQERIFRFQTQRWTVPWTGETIAQVHSLLPLSMLSVLLCLLQ